VEVGGAAPGGHIPILVKIQLVLMEYQILVEVLAHQLEMRVILVLLAALES
jgi:hypothetical protein